MDREKIVLRCEKIRKSFQNKDRVIDVLDGVDIEVSENEFLVVLGPGRCGKTILMNIMAGLMQPDSGKVEMFGKQVVGPDNKVGFVFQRTGLLPWKTVIQNVELGPRMRNIPLKERRETCQHFINVVGLQGFEKSYPRQLSGGMKQRVGIARAYANNTEILIMDEPFGALDAQTRYSMEAEVLKIWEKEKRTVVFVTNNLEEALYLGDRIILLTNSPCRVKKEYRPDISKPRDMMDARFLALRKEIEENMELAL